MSAFGDEKEDVKVKDVGAEDEKENSAILNVVDNGEGNGYSPVRQKVTETDEDNGYVEIKGCDKREERRSKRH